MWYPSPFPTSVQDILCRSGVIPEKARNGSEDLRWVAGKDWIYRRKFSVSEDPSKVHAALCFLGVDTIAEYYLNGEPIGAHESMYLRKEIDISPFLRKENVLTVLFRSPLKEIDRLVAEMPEEWEGVIDHPRLLRKALADSGTFLGNIYPCTCVGLYDEVYLEVTDITGRIEAFDVRQDLTWNLKKGFLELSVRTNGDRADTVRFFVYSPEGELTASCRKEVSGSCAGCSIEILQPELWWPQPYGPQNLYQVKAELYGRGECLDAAEKRIGFRFTEYEGDFRFLINHQRIRLWGSNFVNVDGMSHWCDRERVSTLVAYAKEGNFNIFRIWGEAPMLPDLFYDLCDEAGILIWQDFGLGFGPWPDSSRYQKLFRAEVTQMVSRLKHHPALLLWCGSNETYMTGVSRPLKDGPQYGLDLIFRIGAEVCRELDPGRLYIPSSPMGGNYPQDAAGGDIHGYWGNDFEPGLLFPTLFSESCHATVYCRHSMLRYMSAEEIWPEGYTDTHTYDPDFFAAAKEKGQRREQSYALTFQNCWRQITVPETWKNHLSEFAPSELWDLENYYNAHDADSILYKYAVCGADFYKREIERTRRGRPCRTPFERRRCSGYLTWKYNDAWPHINFTQIDYFLEPVLKLSLNDGFLEIKTDQFARYVELTGRSETGEMSGWKFNDNYFDLLPFETKRIRIGGNHAKGSITAKAFYGDQTTGISF